MAIQNKALYAFRGWIAFVAFMDLGTAARCFIEKRSFLGSHRENEFIDSDFTVSRILGMFLILKALALIHCTLYIHYKPVVSMGYWALSVTILLYFLETLYFHSATINFYVSFPCILNALTLIILIYLPIKLNLWGIPAGVPGSCNDYDDENYQLLRQMGNFKKRRHNGQYMKNKNL